MIVNGLFFYICILRNSIIILPCPISSIDFLFLYELREKYKGIIEAKEIERSPSPIFT